MFEGIAIGQARQRQILNVLSAEPMTVAEIAQQTEIPHQAVLKNLKYLQKKDKVIFAGTRQVGQYKNTATFWCLPTIAQ